jgi:hypothetical protein
LSQQRRMYHLLGVLCGADNSVNFWLHKRGSHTSC